MVNKNDTEDVLDFINSLPDAGTTPDASKGTAKAEKNEDFLEFLDELAAHDTKKGPTPNTSSLEPKKNDAVNHAAVETSKDAESVSGSTSDVKETESQEIDPIGQLSSWWSSEGSTKVSSLWGSIATNAQLISDTTYKLASDTTHQLSQQRQKLLSENAEGLPQLDNLTDKLNSVLTNFSQQIKEGLVGADDELLNILLVHDLDNVAYLDDLCSDKFNQVVRQVEGGIRVSVNNFNHKEQDIAVNLNLFYGKVIDGEKLCFANLESCIKDFSSINHTIGKSGGSEKDGNTAAGSAEKSAENSAENPADKPSDDPESEDSPAEKVINTSNVFISIQPITSRAANEESETKDGNGPIMIDSTNKDSFSFTLILKDITNNITIITKTQPFPLQWALWLSNQSEIDEENVNPAHWVSGWIRDGLSLSFGVLAQQYVVKRMGY